MLSYGAGWNGGCPEFLSGRTHYKKSLIGGKSMKRSLSLVLCLCFLFMLSGMVKADEITNPILKKLVEKGVLTEQEALSVMHDMEKHTAEADKKVEQKIEQKVEQKVTEAAPASSPALSKDVEKVAKALKGIGISGLWYISYQYGENGHAPGADGRPIYLPGGHRIPDQAQHRIRYGPHTVARL
jgi:polyhydroxyalkanoate synthesis regulator phasin